MQKELKKVLDLGRELEDHASMVLGDEVALEALLNKYLETSAKNQREIRIMWRQAQEKLEEKYPEEPVLDLSFSQVERKFIIKSR